MQHIIENLKDVEWIEGCDEICNKCPHCIEGSCTSEKVNRYDAKVKAIVCKDRGNWAEQKAIFAGIDLYEICPDCQWFSLCKKRAIRNLRLKTLLSPVSGLSNNLNFRVRGADKFLDLVISN